MSAPFFDKKKDRKNRWERFKLEKLSMGYTLMLVPHSGRKAVHIKIPLAVISACVALLFGLLGLTTFFAYSSYRLNLVKAENAGLKKVSASQERQIEELDALADDMLERLDAVSESEDAVREKVGLKPRMSGMGGLYSDFEAAPASVSPIIAGDLSLHADLNELSQKLGAVSSALLTEEQNSLILISDVDARLDALDRIPDRWPVRSARLTSRFGTRENPFRPWRTETHSGIDLACDYEEPVYAAAKGVVTFAGYQSGWGNVVTIDHGNGYVTVYGHLSSASVADGELVQKGKLIAGVGSTGRSTGVHLHFSVEYKGADIDPLSVLGDAPALVVGLNEEDQL